MNARSLRPIAALSLLAGCTANAQSACFTGSYGCDDATVGDVRFGYISTASLAADCLYLYEYTLMVNTGGKEVDAGANHTSEGGYGINAKSTKRTTADREKFASVSFYAAKIPKKEKSTFSAESNGVTVTIKDQLLCVPGEPCERPKKKSSGKGESGTTDNMGQLEFDSEFIEEYGVIQFTLINSGSRVATFDWVGVRERGIDDLRGVLAPGEVFYCQVPAARASEEFLALDVDFEDAGGFVARVPAIVPFDGRCDADCDGNGRLDIRDFFCFQNRFAAGDSYADFDHNGRMDIRDFFCFQRKYAEGCP